MIVGIIGNLGSGKTLTMTKLLWEDFRIGKRVLANYGLKFDYDYVSFESALELFSDNRLQNCSIGIDELQIFLDSRASSKKKNRILTYFILQSRKRSINFYYTTQFFGQVDVRVRNVTDYIIKCDVLNLQKEKFILNTFYTHDDWGSLVERAKVLFKASDFYKFYDTNQIILSKEFGGGEE